MMTSYENPVRLVKELKGAPLAILVLLSLSPVAVSREWLEVYSGYSDKPVSKALYYLEENGFILRSAGGWRLSDGSVQLVLPLTGRQETSREEAEFSAGDDDSAADEKRNFSENVSGHPVESCGEPVDKIGEEGADCGENRNFSDSENSSPNGVSRKISGKNRNFSDSGLTTSSINLESNLKESKLIPTNAGENRKNSEFEEPPPEAEPPLAALVDDYRLVAACLAEHGITLNRRTRKLLGAISVDDVYAVIGDLAQQGKQGETGLIVVRLEQRAALGVARRDQVRPYNGDFRRYSSNPKYRHLLANCEDDEDGEGNEPDMDPPEIDMDPGDDGFDPVWDVER